MPVTVRETCTICVYWKTPLTRLPCKRCKHVVAGSQLDLFRRANTSRANTN